MRNTTRDRGDHQHTALRYIHEIDADTQNIDVNLPVPVDLQ